MPRAKKELESISTEKNITNTITESNKKVSRAKTSDIKKAVDKKTTAKKIVSNTATPTKKVASTSKATIAKKSSSKAKTATKVVEPSKTVKKEVKTVKSSDRKISSTSTKTTKVASTTKAKVTKKSSKTSTVPKVKTTRVKKATSKKVTTLEKNSDNSINILEYYDLPYRYNETVVKILAQTPKILFVYWDISDDDRKKYTDKYGEYYFNDSYPVLLVHNKTLNYTQEIEINDFANSWYISLPDSRCEYNVTLARRFKEYAKNNPNLLDKSDIHSAVTVVSSNNLIMPNDHVLLDELKPEIKYRNVKTGQENMKTVKHILKDNNLIDFYNLYQQIYQVEDLSRLFELNNPSSGIPTSTFK